jgi:hypothetical protein
MEIKIKRLYVLIGIAFILSFGLFRVYYGGGLGIKLVAKNSFSFSDTIVNLDDILGMPRIVVATKHPAVKMQLEQMGVSETDEQIEEKTRNKINTEIKKQMAEYEQIMKNATRN